MKYGKKITRWRQVKLKRPKIDLPIQIPIPWDITTPTGGGKGYLERVFPNRMSKTCTSSRYKCQNNCTGLNHYKDLEKQYKSDVNMNIPQIDCLLI